MLEHAQHAELALLVDQSVVGDDGEIEMQRLDDPDGGDDVVLLDLVYHVHSLSDLAEDRVNAVEVGLGRVGDEELTSASVLAGMSHGQGASSVLVGIQVSLTLDLVTGAASTDPRIVGLLRKRIAALDHEIGDYPVESGSVVELAVGQLLEVADGARHLGVEQLGLYGSLAGFDSCALSHVAPLGIGCLNVTQSFSRR
jgi:hypothetical protein